MRLTRLVAFRSLASRRMRTLLTLFGIVLGVAAVFAIQATNRNAYDSIERLFQGTSGKVDLEVRSATNTTGIPVALLETIRQQPGIADAVPVLRLPVVLASDTPSEINLSFFGLGGGLILNGIDVAADPRVREYELTAGRFLTADDVADREVVLVADYAAEQDIELGDEIAVITARGRRSLAVVGLIAKRGAGQANLGKLGVVALPTAQAIAQREDEADQIDIIASQENSSDPAALAALRESLQEVLGGEYSVGYPASQGDQMIRMLSGYQIGLNFLAGIALFVGAFLIYNAFSMTVTERTREFGLLRAVGMSRGQAVGQVLIEGLLLGTAGAILGAVLGVAMARGLTAMTASLLGQDLDAGGLQTGVLAISMTIGVVVTVLAAALPALQAGKVMPLEAIRVRARADSGWLLRQGWLAGLAMLAVAGAVLIWNPFPYDVQFKLGSLTVFALFTGGTLVVPVTLGGWRLAAGWVFRLIFGRVGAIGMRNLERSRSRTMLTCAALMVGVSMVIVIQGMTASFSADLRSWMDAYIGGDVFVGSPVPLALGVQEELEAIEGVAAAAPLRYAAVTWLAGDGEEREINAMAVDPPAYTAVTRFVFAEPKVDEAAAIAELGEGGTVFVSSVIAEKYGLQPGDLLRLRTRDGSYEFRVAAVVLDFYNQGLVVTVSFADLDRHFGLADAGTFLVKAAPGTTAADLVTRIEAALDDDYQPVVESNAAVKDRALSLLGQAFGLFDVLGVISVMVASLGIVNTLSMSVVERTREIGMLRSIGMTRAQTMGMVLAEAGLVGIIGGVTGLAFGIALTRIFLAAMTAMSGYALEFVLPARALWLSVLVALGTSQLAALLPAVRAANTPMLAAIRYE